MRRWAVAVPLLVMLVALPAWGAADGESVDPASRIGGADRYETAALIARASFPDGPNRAYDVFVATGENFPDALAAAYVAGAFNAGGPVLLTPRDSLHSATRQVIEDLAWRVFILGDATAVSETVESEIRAITNARAPQGMETDRIAGEDRYATAFAVMSKDPDHGGEAIIASGENFPDAMVAGPLSYSRRLPILLTAHDVLPDPTRLALQQGTIREVVIVGGTTAVSAAVEMQIQGICNSDFGCIRTRRIAGRDRTETAVLMADELRARGITFDHVNLARGDAFPDALAGAPHAGEETAPVLLTPDPTSLGEATRTWLRTNAATIDSLHVFGSPVAVSDATMQQAQQAISE